MEFSVNHPLLYIMAGFLVAVVLAQSIFFLIKALRRSRELGMDQTKIRKTILTASVFTIAPAVAIVISVFALSKSLGIPLPWLRLSVVGSMSYEAIAANNAVEGGLAAITEMTAQQYINITLVMTISILVGIWLVPLISKKLLNSMSNLSKRDVKWASIFSNSMFIGMIAAFLGFVFCDVSRLWLAEDGFVTITAKEVVDGVQQTVTKQVPATSGLTPVAVMLSSAVVMALCGLLMNKFKWKWLNDYALPIALVAGMAAASPFTAWLG